MAALAGLVLAGCNKGPVAPTAPEEIRVAAGIGQLTRVAYDGNRSAFEKGDRIVVYAWMGDAAQVPAKKVVDGVVNTYDGEVWTPAVQMLWKNVVDSHYFLGVAPVHGITSFTADPYTLDPADRQGSDLLIARIMGDGVKATDSPVSLTFEHAMARLDVNLKFRNQWTADYSATSNTEALVASVVATAKSNATVDYLAKEVTATGEQGDISLNKIANASWSALMVPQAGFTTLTINLDGNDPWLGGNDTHVFTHSADIPLQSGKVTTVNLIVGRDRIEVETVTIDPWLPGESYADEDVEEPVSYK